MSSNQRYGFIVCRGLVSAEGTQEPGGGVTELNPTQVQIDSLFHPGFLSEEICKDYVQALGQGVL